MLQRGLRKLIWPLLLPGLSLYLVVWLWPNIAAFYWALTDYDGVALTSTFVGLQNFRHMLGDHRWWNAVGNTGFLAAGTMVTLLPGGLLFAVLIKNARGGRSLFKGLVYTPGILSLVVVALLWSFILHPMIGLFNQGLKAIGLVQPLKELLGVRSLNWLGFRKLALPTLVLIQFWHSAGFYTLLFLAGLAKIPQDIYDAARIDGASGWTQFRYVTWPLLYPTTQTLFLLLIVDGLQIFTIIYALIGGWKQGSPTTEVMATYVYRMAFASNRMGYATALAVFLMGIVMAVTLIAHEVSRREAVQY